LLGTPELQLRPVEAGTQLGVFGFELSKTLPQRTNPFVDFPLGEAGGDVLRAIPVKGFQPQPKDAF
jgi:hypothetical protein